MGHTFASPTRLCGLVTALALAFCVRSEAQETLTLERALQIAMNNSSGIKRTQYSLDRSRESLTAQRASLKSRFSLSLNPFSIGKNQVFDDHLSKWITTDSKQSQGTFTISQPVLQTNGTFTVNNRFSWQDSYSNYADVRNKAFNNNLSLGYTQPIFTYNSLKLETQELELDLENSLLNYNIQKLQIELQVTQSYYNLYQAKMNYDIAIAEQANQDASFQIIKNKVEAGLSAQEEFYQGELNLLTSQSSVENARRSMENNMDTFKVLIGMPLSESFTVDANVDFEPVPVDLDMALKQGLSQRMELRQSQINIETALNAITRAESQNEFRGNINLSLGLTGTDRYLESVYDTPTRSQSIGISFDIPLWDWGASESRVNMSKISLESQRLSTEDQKIDIEVNIRSAYRNLNQLETQITIQEQSVRNAELTYEINLERYKNGDLTSLDLNLYQTQLSQQRMSLVRALIDYRLALLQMKIQTLWDFETNTPVLTEDTL